MDGEKHSADCQTGYTNAAYCTNDPMDSFQLVHRLKTGSIDIPTRNDSSLDLHVPEKTIITDNVELKIVVSTVIITHKTSDGIIAKPKKNWYKCKPKWGTIKTFVVILCMLQCVNTCITGYLASVLSTIEKQFNMPSRISGFVVSSAEIGSLLSVVFVSYFGTHAHVPRWIGLGGLVLALGSFLFSVPNFLPQSSSKSTTCQKNVSTYSTCETNLSLPKIQQMDVEKAAAESTASNYVYILIAAQILLGAGGSPLVSLGTPYIDSNAEKSDSAVYIAITYIMMAIGPICGFILGAGLLTQYVNPFQAVQRIISTDADWIGFWWGGFVICGVLYLLSSIPFLWFPRQVAKSQEILTNSKNNNSNDKSTYGRSWKKIPISIFRLATNSVYIITTIDYCVLMTIVHGVTTFLPKYMESEFYLTPSKASLLTGIIAVPGLCTGIYFGGWIIKRYKLEMKGVSIMIIVVNIVAALFLILFFILGCSSTSIAGLTTGYDDNNLEFQINLTNPCNSHCRCTMQTKDVCEKYVDSYFPICIGNLSYVTPCHAGCNDFNVFKHNSTWSGHCLCNEMEYSGATGLCPSNCKMLIPFLILLFLVCLTASNNQMPFILITLRSVAEEEKSFAMGVQIVLLRLLCFIPGPLIYGSVIDSACILWNNGSTDKKGGSCDVYDLKKLRLRFAGISMILLLCGLMLTVLVCWCIRRRFSNSTPITMSELVERMAEAEGGHLHVKTKKNLSATSRFSVDDCGCTPKQKKQWKKFSF